MKGSARTLLLGLSLASVLCPGCLEELDRKPFGIAAGWSGAARTELGTGAGWAVNATFPAWQGDPYGLTMSSTRHPNDGDPARVWRAGYGLYLSLPISFVIYDLSWALHVDDHDGWGTGPRFGCGVGEFREDFEAYILPSAYVWVGGRDGDLDLGIEGGLRAVMGVRF